MRTPYLLVVASAAVVVVACKDGTSASPLPRTGKAALAATSNHHVVGSGHVPVGLTDDLREFTFHAVESPDGSVSGSYQVERTDTGIFFTVDVTCMSVVGDTGFVAGIISATNSPAVRVGTISYCWAVDNGEGSHPRNATVLPRGLCRDSQGQHTIAVEPKAPVGRSAA